MVSDGELMWCWHVRCFTKVLLACCPLMRTQQLNHQSLNAPVRLDCTAPEHVGLSCGL